MESNHPIGTTTGGGVTRHRTRVRRPRASATQVGNTIAAALSGQIAQGSVISSAACAGKVRIVASAGGRTVARSSASVRSTCRWSKRLRFSVRRLPARLRSRRARLVLTIKIKYLGASSRGLAASPTSTIRVRVRR